MLNPSIVDNGLKLTLPNPNEFIPKDFEILPEESDYSEIPILIEENDTYELWYKKDDKFKMPKVSILGNLRKQDDDFWNTI